MGTVQEIDIYIYLYILYIIYIYIHIISYILYSNGICQFVSDNESTFVGSCTSSTQLQLLAAKDLSQLSPHGGIGWDWRSHEANKIWMDQCIAPLLTLCYINYAYITILYNYILLILLSFKNYIFFSQTLFHNTTFASGLPNPFVNTSISLQVWIASSLVGDKTNTTGQPWRGALPLMMNGDHSLCRLWCLYVYGALW